MLTRDDHGVKRVNNKGDLERAWLFHGTTADTVPKITQQGFNRAFAGKNDRGFCNLTPAECLLHRTGIDLVWREKDLSDHAMVKIFVERPRPSASPAGPSSPPSSPPPSLLSSPSPSLCVVRPSAAAAAAIEKQNEEKKKLKYFQTTSRAIFLIFVFVFFIFEFSLTLKNNSE